MYRQKIKGRGPLLESIQVCRKIKLYVKMNLDTGAINNKRRRKDRYPGNQRSGKKVIPAPLNMCRTQSLVCWPGLGVKKGG